MFEQLLHFFIQALSSLFQKNHHYPHIALSEGSEG